MSKAKNMIWNTDKENKDMNMNIIHLEIDIRRKEINIHRVVKIGKEGGRSRDHKEKDMSMNKRNYKNCKDTNNNHMNLHIYLPSQLLKDF